MINETPLEDEYQQVLNQNLNFLRRDTVDASHNLNLVLSPKENLKNKVKSIIASKFMTKVIFLIFTFKRTQEKERTEKLVEIDFQN